MLDNCEHLIEQAAEFTAGLVESTHEVFVLATSREPLNVAGEISWRVPSLRSPDRPESRPREELLGFEAVQLFVDRARRARPDLAITAEDMAVVAQICTRLDGIALAIELAAARCRHLDIETVAAGLDDRFHLLGGGSRIALPRQRTLEASIAWSYDLADADERRLLRALGVFSGTFTLDAVESVVATESNSDVLELLSRLVDKNLVEHVAGTRFRLLESIRAFALQRAREHGELDETRRRQAAWWLDRIDTLGTGPTDTVILVVDEFHHDLIACLEWLSRHDVVLALALMRPLVRAFQGTGHAGGRHGHDRPPARRRTSRNDTLGSGSAPPSRPRYPCSPSAAPTRGSRYLHGARTGLSRSATRTQWRSHAGYAR